MKFGRWKYAMSAALAAAAFGVLVGPTHAQDYYMPPTAYAGANPSPGPASMPGQLDINERLRLAEAKIEALAQQAAETKRLPTVDDTQWTSAGGNPGLPPGEAGGGGQEPVLVPLEKYPTARLSGFFQLDTGMVSQDAANRAVLGDIQNGTGFRRTQLQAIGKVGEFTNYTIQMDFSFAGRPSFFDVWGEQTNLPIFGNLRIGNFRQPFSMDALTAVRQIEFLERSLPFQAFVPFRRVGIMAYDKTEDELTTLAYSVYRTAGFDGTALGDSRYASDIGDNGGISFSTRGTHLLYYDEPSEGRYLLHLGGGYNYSSLTGGPEPNSNIYLARVNPEFFVGHPEGTANAPPGTSGAGTPFVLDTGRIRAYGFNLAGIELAGQYGPAHFQAEYMATSVNQMNAPNLFYDGYYIQGGYFLTGEHLKYDRTFGAFNGCTPFSEFFSLGRGCGICGWGAWELTGRWSYVNLFDPNAAPVPPYQVAALPNTPNPGSLNSLTLGVNWHWNSQTKVQFNYVHSMLNSQFNGNSTADFYAMRFQVGF